MPIGNMIVPATSARMAANTIFSTPTIPTGMGASRRSSISLVKLKSITSGKAVLWSAVSTTVMATMPGNSTSV